MDRCDEDREVEDLWCTVEGSIPEDLGVEMDASVEQGEVGAIEENIGESIKESETEMEGVAKDLDSVAVSCSKSELSKLAGEVGPLREGSDGVKFRQCVLTDESLKTWRELGKRGERGFKWDKERLLRGMYVS